jgi:hypothetical protein
MGMGMPHTIIPRDWVLTVTAVVLLSMICSGELLLSVIVDL